MQETILSLTKRNNFNSEIDRKEPFRSFMDIYDCAFSGKKMAFRDFEMVIICEKIKDICLRICNNWGD